jgi:hypothetical protein
MTTPSIQTLITQAQQVLNLKSTNEIRATLAAVLANANVGTPLNPSLTTQQLWDEFYEIVRQPSDDIMSIVVDQMMRMVFSPPAPGGAGADKQVIFNDGGVLAGDAGLTYNKATDALTITGAATVGTTLGVTGQLSTANVVKATGNPGLSAAGATEAFVAHNTTYGAILYGQGTTYDAALLDRNTGLRLSVTTAGAQVGGDLSMTSGNVVMATSGKGIDFSATAGTGTSELLNDYEEGNWTIGLEFGGASTGMTKNAYDGKYTKIGRQVTVTGYLALSNKGSSTGNALITGLPFLINSYGGLSIYLAQITFADFPMGYSNNGTSTIPLRECTNAGVTSSLTDSDFANNSEIIFTMTYNVA